MTKLKWWLRVVGGFYLALTLMNLYFLFLSPQFFAEFLPPPMLGNALAGRAFADAWLVFVFELGVLGVMMLYASRDPANSKMLVWAIIAQSFFVAWSPTPSGLHADTPRQSTFLLSSSI